MKELKSCPFCGSEDLSTVEEEGLCICITCEDCGAKGPVAVISEGEPVQLDWLALIASGTWRLGNPNE